MEFSAGAPGADSRCPGGKNQWLQTIIRRGTGHLAARAKTAN